MRRLNPSFLGRGCFLAPPSCLSNATPRVISRSCWNLVTFSQITWDIFLGKNNFQLFYCFHLEALLFMNARIIVGHLLPIFDGCSLKLPEIAKSLLKIVFFVILNTSLPFWFEIFTFWENGKSVFSGLWQSAKVFFKNLCTYGQTILANISTQGCCHPPPNLKFSHWLTDLSNDQR